ncbi:hypothetical protein [Kerstersia gyiorum]|nr:hypothetical protein [Kerstersia gyiorum]
MQAGLQANVDGVPTYKLASQKDSLEVMAACAEAEANTYWAQPLGERQCAAPFYFERAAILYRKAKQHDDEVRICESWIAIDEDFANQTAALAGGTPSMPRSQAIHARIGKARSLRDKARQSAGSVATATSVNAQAAAVTPPSSPTEKS